MKLGRHMPTESAPLKALQTAVEIGCETIQIFVSNPTGWAPPAENEKSASQIREGIGQLNLTPLVIHATYLINLANPEEPTFEKSVNLLSKIMQRGDAIGAASVVFHVNSHKGSGLDAGLKRLTEGVKRVLDNSPETVMLLLENDVGSGNRLGDKFEHLQYVLQQVNDYSRVGVCIDTAHLWGAGYEITSAAGTNKVIEELDSVIGCKHVPVIHFNDNPKEFGTHQDRHARIGEGLIPLETFSTFLTHPKLANTAFILETPIEAIDAKHMDWEHDKRHLQRVRELAKAGAKS